jgi:hypothetical protein
MADVPLVTIANGVPTGGTGTVQTLSTVTDRLGEVQASPTANTLLDRLKQLHTDLTAATPAGTAIIGKVTTDQTTPGTTDRVTANVDKVGGSALALGQALAAASVPVVLTAAQLAALTAPVLAAGENHIGAVGGHTAPVEITFKTAAGTVTIPGTPSAYTVGATIGTDFTITGAARVSGGGGQIAAVELIEELGASAYNGQAVTATAAGDIITLNSHTLVNGNAIKFGGTAAPGGLTAGTTYYVVGAATNTFQVATSPGGSAIDITSTGTSVTITEVPMKAPAYLYLGRATLGTFADAAAFAPTGANFDSALYPVTFTSYLQVGLQAVADAAYSRPYQCSGSANLFGLLAFNGLSGQAPSKQASFKLRIWFLQD